MMNKVPIMPLMDLLDVICIAALRSKDFVNYEKYLRLYSAHALNLKQHPDEFSYYDFIPSIDAGDLYLCTNRADKAYEVLTKLFIKYKNHRDSPRIYFLLRINLIVAHFVFGEFDKCIKLYNEIIQYGEKSILDSPGLRIDFMIYTDIYAAICYYLSDDKDYSIHIINKIKRKYAAILNGEINNRLNYFLAILEKLAKNPNYQNSLRFKNDINAFVKLQEYVPGDTEYISLNAWLKSIHLKDNYYSQFIKEITSS